MNRMRGVTAMLLLGCALPLQAAEVMGSLQWVRRVELSTPVSGVVQQTPVEAGAQVRKGQPLLILDQRGFRAALQRADARVEKLAVVRDEARRELERTTELYDRTLISEHELQVAKIAYAGANADWQGAEAERVQARLELEYSTVTAPFNGVVLQRSAEIGQTVVTRLQSVPLMVLAETGRMLVRIEVSEQELAALAMGQKLPVRVDGRNYEGKVQRLGMEPVIAAGGVAKYEADLVFEYPAADRLRAGQGAAVLLP